jgi:hypothetical protein
MLEFVQGNTAPSIQAALTYDDGSGPVDLTSASVKFLMRRPEDRRFTVNAAANIVGNPTLGNVSYSWAPNDLNVAGQYETSWQVTFLGGRIQSNAAPNLISVRRQ